jgi:DNA-binding NarL/FixJ family response regulator
MRYEINPISGEDRASHSKGLTAQVAGERGPLPVRILLADDDLTIRMLIRRLLESNPDWEVCGEAGDGMDAVHKVMQLRPDLVILDLSMPKMNGLDSGREIARLRPSLPMLLVTVQRIEGPAITDIFEAGFKGAVTKENGAEVVRGVEALLSGEFFFDSQSRPPEEFAVPPENVPPIV